MTKPDKTIINWFGLLGVLSFISYMAAVIFPQRALTLCSESIFSLGLTITAIEQKTNTAQGVVFINKGLMLCRYILAV